MKGYGPALSFTTPRLSSILTYSLCPKIITPLGFKICPTNKGSNGTKFNAQQENDKTFLGYYHH